MFHRPSVFLFCVTALACCLATACSPPAAQHEDDASSGQTSFDRICSVSLAGDELLALLVPVERVVCVSSMADDPELSNVVDHFPKQVRRLTAKIEPVLAASPDLVLAAPWNEASFRQLLQRSGVRSISLQEVHDFDGIRQQLLSLGRALGVEQRAGELATEFDRRLSRLRRSVQTEDDLPRVLSFSHMVVAGSETTVDAMIQAAHGRNAARELGLSGHRRVNIEQIIELDPDVLLLGFDPNEDRESLLKAYPHLALTRAARRGRVIILPPRLLSSVTPFALDGAEQLTRLLHPQAAMARAGS